MVRAARALLSAVTRLLILADMADVMRLLAHLKIVSVTRKFPCRHFVPRWLQLGCGAVTANMGIKHTTLRSRQSYMILFHWAMTLRSCNHI